MNTPTSADAQGTSTRPYLIRALHDWCTDNGFTPYLAVYVDGSVQVPAEYVKNNEIVLNVGFEATSGLQLGNEFIEFRARFGGVAREIVVPVDHVIAIYARENGQGMAFPLPADGGAAASAPAPAGGGLRLAHGAGDEEPKVPAAPASLAPVPSPAPAADAGPDDDRDPPPATPAAGRPALKRVK
jgi:stringent starvation protein B